MAYPLIIAGILLLIVSARNTQGNLWTLLRNDFLNISSAYSFLYWILAIGIVWSIRFIPKLRSLSNSFLVLIFLGFFLSNKSFFTQFVSQISSAVKSPQETIGNAPTYNVEQVEPGNSTVNVSGGSSSSTTVLSGSSSPISNTNQNPNSPSINSSFGNLPSLNSSFGNQATNLNNQTIGEIPEENPNYNQGSDGFPDFSNPGSNDLISMDGSMVDNNIGDMWEG